MPNPDQRTWLFSLRREHGLSGERSARRFLMDGCPETGGNILDLNALLETRHGPGLGSWLLRPYRVWREFRRQAPHTLIIKVPTLGQVPLAMLLGTGYGGRLLLWVEGLCWQWPGRSAMLTLLWHEPLLTLARMLLNRPRISRRFGEFIVASEVQAQEILARAPGARVHRLPNSIRAQRRPRSAKTPGEPLRIGYIGHSYITKGVGDLLEALARLRKDGLPYTARFAFSDLGSRRLRKAVLRGGHELLGEVEPAVFFRDLDVAVFPYWTQWGTNLFPNVLIESLCFGVPVVTTDLPVIRECFGGDNSMATLVPPRAPGPLADALADLITGRLKVPATEDLHALYDRHYDPERIGQAWQALLEKPGPP